MKGKAGTKEKNNRARVEVKSATMTSASNIIMV